MRTVGDLLPSRRRFLELGGLGLTLAATDTIVPRVYANGYKAKPRGTARNIIYYELSGALSHVESFDFKTMARLRSILNISVTIRRKLNTNGRMASHVSAYCFRKL